MLRVVALSLAHVLLNLHLKKKIYIYINHYLWIKKLLIKAELSSSFEISAHIVSIPSHLNLLQRDCDCCL